MSSRVLFDRVGPRPCPACQSTLEGGRVRRARGTSSRRCRSRGGREAVSSVFLPCCVCTLSLTLSHFHSHTYSHLALTLALTVTLTFTLTITSRSLSCHFHSLTHSHTHTLTFTITITLTRISPTHTIASPRPPHLRLRSILWPCRLETQNRRPNE